MTRSQAYERKADEAEAVALMARTLEARQAMRDLARRWRALAAEERRGLSRTLVAAPFPEEDCA
jgi:hypothetical protein